MPITSRAATTYLIAAQVTALGVGYILRSPDLQATAQRQDTIRFEQKQAAFDRQAALNRALRCVVLATELPLTDGTAGYFSSVKGGRIVINKNRPMPSGTTVCDAFGNTGVIATDNQGTPVITELQSMPPEEMEKVLTQRGVMPQKNSRPFAPTH